MKEFGRNLSITMDKPKVAIIIPNYNKESFLPACIESATNQTYSNIEIIIVDDHSTDHSDSIIKKLIKGQPNIKYYRLPKNRGVSHARNYGAAKATADFLVFLDSDDVYINNKKIENEVTIINNNKIAFSQWVPMDTNGTIKPYKKYLKNPLRYFAISKILSVSLPPYQQLRGYMIPTRIFREIGGYNTKLSFYEDFDLQCRLALHTKKFEYTQNTGEAYRLGTNGLSSQSTIDAARTIENIRQKYIPKLSLTQKIMYHIYMRKK